MTYTEQAIKEADRKGGYNNFPTGSELMTDNDRLLCLLDPLFWQALGKARGWEERDHLGFKFQPPLWKKKWHNFVDHLAEGKDAESFFKELLGR